MTKTEVSVESDRIEDGIKMKGRFHLIEGSEYENELGQYFAKAIDLCMCKEVNVYLGDSHE